MLHYVITYVLFTKTYGFEVTIDKSYCNLSQAIDTLNQAIELELPFEGCKYQLYQIQ